MPAGLPHGTRGAAFDAAVFVLGGSVGAYGVAQWIQAGELSSVWILLAPVVLVVLAQFPLIVSEGGGDAVIGFEFCVLVYLALTTNKLEAGALWAIGTTLAHIYQRKSLRSRAFNVGLTNLLGPVSVAILVRAKPVAVEVWRELFWVGVACAVYFLLDLIVTGVSLTVDGEGRLSETVPLRTIPLPLACFVGIDTLGYLGALTHLRLPAAALALLLVPVSTIVVAARAVSRARLDHRRMNGLFEAASTASRLPETVELEAALVRHAEAALRASTVQWRSSVAVGREIGAQLAVAGRSDRYLIARRDDNSGAYFDDDDRRALEALVGLAAESVERRRLVDEMAYLAQHDPLTGLGNRTVLMDRMAHGMRLAGRHGRTLCVLYVDLDGFKKVNDRMGHHAGDRLLVAVAGRLQTCTRRTDTLARLGGDEFALLFEEVAGGREALDVAERILAALSAPFLIEASEIRIGGSIGVAFGHDAADGADLLQNADLALYRAKTRGRGRVEARARVAGLQPAAPGAGGGGPSGRRPGCHRAALPADHRAGHRDRDRLRGAGQMEIPAAGEHPARRLHPGHRADRADLPARRAVTEAGGGGRWAALRGRGSSADGGGQRVGRTAGRVLLSRPAGRVDRGSLGTAGHRVDRGHAARGGRGHRGRPGRDPRQRRLPVGRRLRGRVLLDRLPAQADRGQPENRQVVRPATAG